jgi:hypothetical protein
VNRDEALKIAREHVAAIGTNARGYQDGVTFAAKVDAVERFARFLLEGGEDAPEELAELRRAGDRLRDRDDDVWTLGADGRWHLHPGSNGETLEYIERRYGPVAHLPRDEEL